MGTRGLTVIIKNNKIKLSNYQQWDSYFDYTGVRFLEFCKKLQDKYELDRFSRNVDLLVDISNDKKFTEQINNTIDMYRQDSKKYYLGINQLFPQFSRDTGVRILDIIKSLYDYEFHGKKYPVFVTLDTDFIEYINVLDLDKKKVYMLRLETNNFDSLETNNIVEENFIDKGFECYLSYDISKIPSIKKATEQYKKTLAEEDVIPF